MRLITLMVSSLIVAPLATIASQQSPAVKAGDRVRVIAPSVSGSPFVGTLVALEADSLVVHDTVNTWRLSLASVEQVDLSRGRKSHALLGAGIGLLVGAGVGALAGSSCEQVMYDTGITQGECIAIGAAAFGAAGALLGAVTGALVRTERWAQVPLDRLKVSLAPANGRALTFSVAFRF
jgi:hypothetical protein